MEHKHTYGGRTQLLQRRRRNQAVRQYFWGSGLPLMTGLTLVCVFLLLTRPPGLDAWYRYRFLLWNLFLAAVPYGCSLAADLLYRSWPRGWPVQAVLAALWLVFLPNAPYILTDFIHLRDVPAAALRYDAVLIGSFALTGCLLGAMSLLLMQGLVRCWAGSLASWTFAVTIIGLSGVGIYMGRVLRWNSWHLVTRPRQIIDALAEALSDPLDHPHAITLSVLLAGFLLGSYILFFLVSSWLLQRSSRVSDSQPQGSP